MQIRSELFSSSLFYSQNVSPTSTLLRSAISAPDHLLYLLQNSCTS